MKERIGYIDALRGFIMLLVVMWHAKLYSIDFTGAFSFNDISFLVMMPVFFFISGLVGARKNDDSVGNILKWTGGKFLKILLPTLVFMLLWGLQAGWSVHRLFFDVSKGGFWFTILLPFYFIIYVLLLLTFKKGCKLGDKAFSTVHITIGLLIYLGTAFIVSPFNPVRNETLNGLLSVVHFRYYLFFAIGTEAAVHREPFLKWSKNPWVSAMLIGLFAAGCTVYFNIEDKLWQTLLLLVIALSGTQLLFSFFCQNDGLFGKGNFIGKSLQYVGKRTLDIYLLHLFLLPMNLSCIGKFLSENPSPLIELAITFVIASLVILGCLLISRIGRSVVHLEK